MVGGKVVGIVRTANAPCQLTVAEGNDRVSVLVHEQETIRVGDKVWWQGDSVYWTPQPGDGRSDVPLTKASNSFVPLGPEEDR